MDRVEKTLINYRKEFYEVYHRDVLPVLTGLEPQRKAKLSLLKTIELILAVIFIALLFLSNVFLQGFCYVICTICVAAMIMIPIHLNSEFVTLLKKRCVPNIAKMFGEVEWSDNENTINSVTLNKSDLFSEFNLRETDDNFEGEYKGVTFKLAETSLSRESGSGKNKKIVQVFKGVVINFKSNKTIRSKTIIATRGDMNIRKSGVLALPVLALLPLIANMFMLKLSLATSLIIIAAVLFLIFFNISGSNNKEKMNQIKLEDPIFGKKFKVYSSDEVEARYLVTTAFMERFINLNTAFGAKKAKCSFFDNNIMFAITTNKNLFEIGDLFHPLDNPKQITNFFNEIVSVLILVEHFRLNEKTGL